MKFPNWRRDPYKENLIDEILACKKSAGFRDWAAKMRDERRFNHEGEISSQELWAIWSRNFTGAEPGYRQHFREDYTVGQLECLRDRYQYEAGQFGNILPMDVFARHGHRSAQEPPEKSQAAPGKEPEPPRHRR